MGTSSEAGKIKPEVTIAQVSYRLTMLVDNMMPDIPPSESKQMKFIEDYTKTKLDITWLPSLSYNAKVNATIASGKLPQVVVIIDAKNPGVINALRSGVFWEIGPYLKDYPRLNSLNPVVKNNLLVDGKLYGIPRHRDLAWNGLTYRSDWLNHVGLAPPKNLEDVYQAAKAFTEQDPDRNGKPDTFGLLESGKLNNFRSMLVMQGGPNEWLIDNDRFIPAHDTPEYMEVMRFYKKLYDEKWMNQDFAAITGDQAKLMYEKGKAGMSFSHVEQITERMPALLKVSPDADLKIAPFIGPKGERIHPSMGYSGIYLISKSSVKTEPEMRRILQFFEDLAAPDIQTFMQWGLEGEHYKMEDGKPTKIDEARYQKEINSLRQLKPHTMSDFMEGKDSMYSQRVSSYYREKESKVIANPAMPFISDTFAEKGNELDGIIMDARVKFVMGLIDEKGWQQAIEEWRMKGGTSVTEEYTELYKKNKK
jgi:putative aldouronate transport system substrate-binding protein